MIGFLLSMVTKYGVIGFLFDVFIVTAAVNGIGITIMLLFGNKKSKEEINKKNGDDYEKMVADGLKKYKISEKIYRNVIMPYEDISTEADMIFVNRKGIFCIECKYHNQLMKPLIEGSLSHNEWKVTQSVSMPNPFRQNERHIYALESEIGSFPVFNVVCVNAQFIFQYFGNRYNSDQHPYLNMKKDKKILICTCKSGYKQFKEDIEDMPDVISNSDIEHVKEYLSSHEGTEEQRKQHADRIKNQK